MSTRTRTERYDGLHPSQVQAACAADAAQGAQIGWIPTDQEWVGQTLLVTYSRGGPFASMPAPEWPPDQAWVVPAATLRSRVAPWLGAAIGIGVTAGLVFLDLRLVE